jgi:glycerophosphoryl diester phosphodiesterase
MSAHLARLLSHRLRGFDGPEGSLGNLRRALDKGVRLFEVDTRHTCDQEIVVCHSPCLSTMTDRRGLICELPWIEVAQSRFVGYPNQRPARLGEFLEIVAAYRDAEVWIDIKDYGLEELYVHHIVRYGLHQRARLISWMPQTLLRLAAMEPPLALGMSYFCCAKHPYLHHIARAVTVLLGKQARPLRAARHGRLGDVWAVVPYFDLSEDIAVPAIPRELWAGYNHSHMIAGLPLNEVVHALRERQGAIGMLPSQATADIVDLAHEKGLLVYVYSIDDIASLQSLMDKSPVDIAFTNNANLLLNTPTVSNEV